MMVVICTHNDEGYGTVNCLFTSVKCSDAAYVNSLSSYSFDLHFLFAVNTADVCNWQLAYLDQHNSGKNEYF